MNYNCLKEQSIGHVHSMKMQLQKVFFLFEGKRKRKEISNMINRCITTERIKNRIDELQLFEGTVDWACTFHEDATKESFFFYLKEKENVRKYRT